MSDFRLGDRVRFWLGGEQVTGVIDNFSLTKGGPDVPVHIAEVRVGGGLIPVPVSDLRPAQDPHSKGPGARGTGPVP